MNNHGVLAMKNVVCCVLFCSFLLTGCGSEQKKQKEQKAAETSNWEEVQKLYEKAKDAGDDVPKNIADWAKAEFQRMGTWEYRFVRFDAISPTEIEKELNVMGKEKWECFWLEREGNALRLAFKRPAQSYLQALPVKELMKLIAAGQ
jgi:hypothetical protein